MKAVTSEAIKGKKVLLRYDVDVALECKVHPSASPASGVASLRARSAKCKVKEDFKLRAGLGTLKLCLEHAKQVILMGHIGRPEGKIVPGLSIEPIRQWLPESSKLTILENLRFDPREEACDIGYAKELASKGDVYVNEAFSSYHPAVSTTVLPTLLPHFAGLRFAKEVEKLTEVRENPKKPFVAIMGGAKVADKLPVIEVLAQKADAVLVGGKLVKEFSSFNSQFSNNILLGKLNEDGFDIALETVDAWKNLISRAAMIVWNGPLGKFEDPKNNATQKIAQMILDSQAEVVIGGGDSVAALSQYRLLQKAEEKAFVSVGGGAMLKFLASGTLPTVEVLK